MQAEQHCPFVLVIAASQPRDACQSMRFHLGNATSQPSSAENQWLHVGNTSCGCRCCHGKVLAARHVAKSSGPVVLPSILHRSPCSLITCFAELRVIELEEQLELRDRMELRAAAAAVSANPLTASSLSAPAMPVAAPPPMPMVLQPAAPQPMSMSPPAPAAPKPAAPVASKTITLSYQSGWDTVFCHYNLNNKGEQPGQGDTTADFRRIQARA